jgi:hypothetical protein
MSDNKKAATLADLIAALNKYESNRSVLLQRAFDEGGVDSVTALEDEYQALQDSYYDLLNRQLISNSAKYSSLMDETLAATDAIKRSIDGLQRISNVLSAMAKTVDLVGRALVLFGV